MAAVYFLKKLGGKPGQVVFVPGPDLRPFAAGATVLAEPPRREKVRGIVFRSKWREEIPRDLRRYRAIINDDGFIWAVIPKRPAIGELGIEITFDDLLDVALRTDLVDNKTLTFSDEEYGVRFVVRKHLRHR